jgi:hypothetical protein
VISGCYRPSWYRANTTYAELKTDSNWCKGQINIGSTREEVIEQYERCMRNKGYELRDKSDPFSSESTIIVEYEDGRPPTVIDKRTKVYVRFDGKGRYFHKKDCKNLSMVSSEELTIGEAIAKGNQICPECFRGRIRSNKEKGD